MGKRKPEGPKDNDWLFSCSAKLATEEILKTLGIVKQPVIELSAKHWREFYQMANDVMKAYGYSESYLYDRQAKVSLDGLNDWMFINGWENKQFIGEVFIIRSCHPEALQCISIIIYLMYNMIQEIYKKPHLFRDTRLVVVLAGWSSNPIKIDRKTSLIVNALQNNVKDDVING
jgi:hypothetical protein